MSKNYRLSFEFWGLLLFLIIMIPNFIWFAVPAPNDILRTESRTETIDMVANVCQIGMIAALCVLRNKKWERIRMNPFVIGVIGCCLVYFLSWIAYYCGIVNGVVILGLTIPPCFSFLLFALDRRNGIALILISIFTICHLIHGVVNFIL